jgi:phosphotransferase system  glucose/maltose/N-acetylglucosamine-specific IIC component
MTTFEIFATVFLALSMVFAGWIFYMIVKGILRLINRIGFALTKSYFFADKIEIDGKEFMEFHEFTDLSIPHRMKYIETLSDDDAEFYLENLTSAYEEHNARIREYDSQPSYQPSAKVESVPSNHFNKSQENRPGSKGFEVWRYYGATPMRMQGAGSISMAISLAEGNKRRNPNMSFIVKDAATGATVWSG